MNFLFLFLDGVGLGPDTPDNPFTQAHMPNLLNLLGGQRLILGSLPIESQRATLVALDVCMGVAGLPQSATGQATLLTGVNVPAMLGYHYGPKPNLTVTEFLRNDNLFIGLQDNGRRVALLNAYPPSYFEAIESGRRMFSVIPLAVTSAGISLKTIDDLFAGQALSADFTGQGWRDRLGFAETPVLTPHQAGEHLAFLAQDYDFAFFEFWPSDYAGHHQDMDAARSILETFDQVLAGLLASWDDQKGVILLTSDHGNMEDLSTRRHTRNPVPALVIGSPHLREAFSFSLHDLTGVAPAILQLFT